MKKTLSVLAGILLLAQSCKKDDTPVPTPDPVQTIASISPTNGPKNTIVTITGTDFGTNTSALKVYFNGVQGTVQTATGTTITATVPTAAGTGAVKVEKNGTLVTGPVFTYQGVGYVSTFAGGSGGYADGTGLAAQFNLPSGIVKDAAGNFFVCDRDNHKIRKITPAGVVTTFAGSTAGLQDGTGAAAKFNQPYCITIDASGNLYVGDRINHAIRKITAAGVVTTLAGNGTAGNTNGTGAAASFNEPLGVAADASGNIFVADYINGLIRKVTPAGVVTTFQNPGATHIFGIAVDAANNLYTTEYANHRIVKYTSAGVATVIAGTAGTAGAADGTGAAASFRFPAGITVDANGNLYITDVYNNKIRKITSAGVVTTMAGSSGNADGTGAAAGFDSPLAICGDFANNAVFICDFGNSRIRKLLIAE
jgi:serine/threonine protein kinase, bacterial